MIDSYKTKRPHAHLCPACAQLHLCACADGWKVAYVPCGCGK